MYSPRLFETISEDSLSSPNGNARHPQGYMMDKNGYLLHGYKEIYLIHAILVQANLIFSPRKD